MRDSYGMGGWRRSVCFTQSPQADYSRRRRRGSPGVVLSVFWCLVTTTRQRELSMHVLSFEYGDLRNNLYTVRGQRHGSEQAIFSTSFISLLLENFGGSLSPDASIVGKILTVIAGGRLPADAVSGHSSFRVKNFLKLDKMLFTRDPSWQCQACLFRIFFHVKLAATRVRVSASESLHAMINLNSCLI